MPYFPSNSITDAMTTEEQSVSGIKPIFTSVFSGASDPAAQAALRTAVGTRLMIPAAPAFLMKLRRAVPFATVFLIEAPQKKNGVSNEATYPPRVNAVVHAATTVGRGSNRLLRNRHANASSNRPKSVSTRSYVRPAR